MSEDPSAVRPRRSPLQPLGQLRFAPSPQYRHRRIRRLALGCGLLHVPPDLDKLGLDTDLPGVKVNIDPAKPARLAAAKATERDQVEQPVQAMVGDVDEEQSRMH